MEDASNGKIEEAVEKVEETVKEEAKFMFGKVKGLLEELVDGDSEPAAKKSSSSSSSSDSDEEKVEETENPGPVVTVEEVSETVEEVSETVVDSAVEESETNGYQEKEEVFELEAKEEEVLIVPTAEGANYVEVEVDVAEVVTEQVTETTLTSQVETEPEPAQTGVVLPVEEESKDDLAPKVSEESSPQLPPENASADEQVPPCTETPAIIPVTQRVLHPTSWRSCCGLFEILRRSDR